MCWLFLGVFACVLVCLIHLYCLDLKKSVEFSCAAAGLSVLKRGTAQSSPTKIELNKALKTI